MAAKITWVEREISSKMLNVNLSALRKKETKNPVDTFRLDRRHRRLAVKRD